MIGLLKNKWIYGAVVLTALIFIAAWIYAGFEDGAKGTEMQVDHQASADEKTQDHGSKSDTAVPADIEGYFYVQETDGVVNVYRYTNGEKVFFKRTSIAFSLLGDEDQELLKTGVQLKDEQELANFLENFDS